MFGTGSKWFVTVQNHFGPKEGQGIGIQFLINKSLFYGTFQRIPSRTIQRVQSSKLG